MLLNAFGHGLKGCNQLADFCGVSHRKDSILRTVRLIAAHRFLQPVQWADHARYGQQSDCQDHKEAEPDRQQRRSHQRPVERSERGERGIDKDRIRPTRQALLSVKYFLAMQYRYALPPGEGITEGGSHPFVVVCIDNFIACIKNKIVCIQHHTLNHILEFRVVQPGDVAVLQYFFRLFRLTMQLSLDLIHQDIVNQAHEQSYGDTDRNHKRQNKRQQHLASYGTHLYFAHGRFIAKTPDRIN
ncbi:hypothetical protein D3C73_738150 [compost metagenome]